MKALNRTVKIISHYKAINTINDFLIGIWLFILGSVQLLIRPTIKLVHDFHLRKYLKEGYRNK
ncbi:YrhK family protein [Priestia megaterium]|uniref:YrhK family protein n=1 Tax=Priestia megaterium TaxID=1404 RepID=UPI00355AE647